MTHTQHKKQKLQEDLHNTKQEPCIQLTGIMAKIHILYIKLHIEFSCMTDKRIVERGDKYRQQWQLRTPVCFHSSPQYPSSEEP